MTNEQLLAYVVALTAFMTSIAAILSQVAALRKTIDGRMTELLEITRTSAHREGELAGRDFAASSEPIQPKP